MAWLVTKYLLTAAVVVVVTEAAKRSDKLGGFIAALPLVTILALIWLYVEKQPQLKLSNHAWYTFWYVLPTLPMFLLVPLLLRAGINFWLSLGAGCALTIVLYLITAWTLAKFGIAL